MQLQHRARAPHVPQANIPRIRAQQVADLIASRVQNESFEASFLSPTSELLFYPADAALIASGAIAIGTTSVFNRVLGIASFVFNRFMRLGSFFWETSQVSSISTRWISMDNSTYCI
jgi:hypothetical protein